MLVYLILCYKIILPNKIKKLDNTTLEIEMFHFLIKFSLNIRMFKECLRALINKILLVYLVVNILYKFIQFEVV
jgi:hypothetical protein